MTMAAGSEYNQRESDNLMNIVAVVYGVALTTALTSPAGRAPASAIRAVPYPQPGAAGGGVLFTALSFLSYVLAIGGDAPYNIAWTPGSSGGRSVFRYLADLLLAGLYVRLLFAATDVGTGPGSKPQARRSGARLHRRVRRGDCGAVGAPGGIELASGGRDSGDAGTLGLGARPHRYARFGSVAGSRIARGSHPLRLAHPLARVPCLERGRSSWGNGWQLT